MSVEEFFEKLNNPSVLTIEFQGYTVNRIENGFEVCNGTHLIDTAADTQEVFDIIFMNAII